ncbi:hypothetical protein [Paenacidovorax monticola]|uniref:Uncharacterized protein n=1 Tax=Paenacidovorax monticola TaxID=1926868 RepID=A0A7H0HFZ9_9BURK|nr:hypothetical protein [Paenacidovorax monticola]QNP59465.1 hypothetical protein H9L24_22230 [Paenacidovorax monticola]
MSAITDWVTAVSAMVSAIGVVFAARQLQLSRQQFLDDHARSRREVAVQLFADWAKNLDRRATSARKFVQELSQEEVKCIFNSEELSIDSKHAGRLAAALRESPPAEDGGKIRLSVEISSEIRWQLVTYLNNLEAVLQRGTTKSLIEI